jgi:hypothetical protein
MSYKDENFENYSLSNFISLVKNESLAHSNQYSAVFYLPPNLRNIHTSTTSKNNLQRLTLLCDSVSIPGLSVITNNVAVYGEERQMPTQRLFSDMTMTFYVDHNMEVKRIFDLWMDMIINPRTRSAYYYEDYIANIELYVHDRNFNVTYKVALFECYPKAIQQIDMSYASRDVLKMQINFEYKYYLVEDKLDDEESLKHFLSPNDHLNFNSLNPAFDFINNPT